MTKKQLFEETFIFWLGRPDSQKNGFLKFRGDVAAYFDKEHYYQYKPPYGNHYVGPELYVYAIAIGVLPKKYIVPERTEKLLANGVDRATALRDIPHLLSPQRLEVFAKSRPATALYWASDFLPPSLKSWCEDAVRAKREMGHHPDYVETNRPH